MKNFGVAINLTNLAATQYSKLQFNSVCNFEGDTIAACPDGIVILCCGNDNKKAIEALVSFGLNDFGVPNKKRIRKVYIGGESNGQLAVGLTPDNGEEELYEFPIKNTNLQGTVSVSIGRASGRKGRYWEITIQNSNGCDFSIDSLDVLPVIFA